MVAQGFGAAAGHPESPEEGEQRDHHWGHQPEDEDHLPSRHLLHQQRHRRKLLQEVSQEV